MKIPFFDQPWVRIWARPRQVLRGILDSDPKRNIHSLAMAGGVLNLMDRVQMSSVGEHFSLEAILLFSLSVGPLIGLAYLYLGGALLTWTGRWFGGTGTQEEVRAACAWGAVPTLWEVLWWVPALLYFGNEMFTKITPKMDALPAGVSILLGFGMIVFYGCEFVVDLKCLGEAHRFSAWKALGASFIARLLMISCWLIPTAMLYGIAKLYELF